MMNLKTTLAIVILASLIVESFCVLNGNWNEFNQGSRGKKRNIQRYHQMLLNRGHRQLSNEDVSTPQSENIEYAERFAEQR